MLNFTVGPVMSPDEILEVSSNDSPYFRTEEFSKVMLENEALMLEMLNAPDGSRCVFLTASGTGAMEACVMGLLEPGERVVAINGGSFGERFVKLCELHKHTVDEVRVEFGKQVTRNQLESSLSSGASALLVNMNETSSGLLYDMSMISELCREYGALLIVDAISSFIADELDMTALGADAVITGSQKALACHPGASIVALSPRAIKRVYGIAELCMYLSLREALSNGKRGQTPWTPAVTTMLEINTRLRGIKESGIREERSLIAERADGVRDIMRDTELYLAAQSPSNAVSAFVCPRQNAREIIATAKDQFNLWLCPNGGVLADKVFRIGHIGSISKEDMAVLLEALSCMHDQGLY